MGGRGHYKGLKVRFKGVRGRYRIGRRALLGREGALQEREEDYKGGTGAQ